MFYNFPIYYPHTCPLGCLLRRVPRPGPEVPGHLRPGEQPEEEDSAGAAGALGRGGGVEGREHGRGRHQARVAPGHHHHVLLDA